MTRNIRGRLDRLERATPAAESHSVLTPGVFWAMMCGAPGDYTAAELAEWDAIWEGAQEAHARYDQIERLLEEPGFACDSRDDGVQS